MVLVFCSIAQMNCFEENGCFELFGRTRTEYHMVNQPFDVTSILLEKVERCCRKKNETKIKDLEEGEDSEKHRNKEATVFKTLRWKNDDGEK